ncbi:MAG: TetR/AcrR family transcriptional regulator [Hyphomicrobium sp.]
MARRSAHTPEELRQRILEAAQSIIERDGLVGLSAREIARLIGYSPGTLYNIFENLDDVLLTLQTQMLASLVDGMKAVPQNGTPQQSLDDLARAYVDFAIDNKRMWNLLFTHDLPSKMATPAALTENVNMIGMIVAMPIAAMMPKASKQEIDVAARALWAGVHGVTAVAVTEKGPTLNPASAHTFVNQLVSTYTRGLISK